MKTNKEIQVEAQQLMLLGKRYETEHRFASRGRPLGLEPRVLTIFPMTSNEPGRERHVDATIVGGALMFRLMERETYGLALERGESDDEGFLLVSGLSTYDVLRAGYEMAEEDRLRVALERYAERNEARLNPAADETVAEVEELLEAKLLSPTDRMRTKAEVVEFLEGRLKPSVLIAHVIERQCSRDGLHEQQTERHELRLTIGQP